MSAEANMRHRRDAAGDGRIGSTFFAEGSVSDGLRIVLGRIGIFAIWTSVLPYLLLPAMAVLSVVLVMSDALFLSAPHRDFGFADGFVVATAVLGVACFKCFWCAVAGTVVGAALRTWSKSVERARISI